MNFINPLKEKYPIVIRVTSLIGIGLIIINFLLFPRFGNSLEFEDVDQVIIENIDIPQTQQIDNTPPPARPSIPVPSDDEDIADDLTLDELDFDDFSNLDAPPPPYECHNTDISRNCPRGWNRRSRGCSGFY